MQPTRHAQHALAISEDDILGYHPRIREWILPDILIRGIPDHVLAGVEANARRAGLSRAEYLRRMLERDQRDTNSDVTVGSLRRFRETFGALEDSEVMISAWS